MSANAVSSTRFSENVIQTSRPAEKSPEKSSEKGPAFLPLLLVLFVGSGCAALIYEIVWFQLLEFAIGSTAYSIAVLLGTFMGGLCIGSLFFGRLVPAKWHPLRVYAALELGIGILGILITQGLPAIDHGYATMAHGAGSGIFFRAVIAVICLLPPTILMGATLPAIARWIETTPRGVSWLGFFYGGNTVGAVVGCLVAGFFLLPNYSMARASMFGVMINLVVAGLGLAISFRAGYRPAAAMAKAALKMTPMERLRDGSVYVAIGLSGATALGAEVVWTRLLSLLMGATVYTFTIILAVFLVGLGAGSSVGAMMAASAKNARQALAWCQILCVVAIGWAAYAVANGLTHWPVNTYLAVNASTRFSHDLARAAWAILPATLVWGASFPLALAAIASGARPGSDPAKSVGRVYAANTVGAILGALFFSLLATQMFNPRSRSTDSEHMMMIMAGMAAFVALVPEFLPKHGLSESEMVGRLVGTGLSVLCAVGVPLVVIGTLAGKDMDTVPWQLIARGRDTTTSWWQDAPSNGAPPVQMVDWGEGMNSSVAVTKEWENGEQYLYFRIAGKVEASSDPADMRLQLMLGHFPSLFHPEPEKKKKVLIVGCGAGVTAGTFILHPHESITICELEPLVPKMAAYFHEENNSVVTPKVDGDYIDPAVHVVFDDARHYVLTTDDKFDIITSDPIHPWVKGAASLYTKEYFESVKARLNPGGMVTQWVPLYESSEEVVKSEIKTFFDVFPNGTIWLNAVNGGGYDVILLGSVEPIKIDAAALGKRLENQLIAGKLKYSGLGTVEAILSTYGGRKEDLVEWTKTGQTNSDANLRLQYLAGLANTRTDATDIQMHILKYRRFPEGMLTVGKDLREELEGMWGLSGR